MILFWGGIGVVIGIIYVLIEVESKLNDGNR
jgi:xanthosine utilization system XapX-like protein